MASVLGVHRCATFTGVLSPQCLQHLDVSVLGELVPRLCELLRSGVGLGTKVPVPFGLCRTRVPVQRL